MSATPWITDHQPSHHQMFHNQKKLPMPTVQQITDHQLLHYWMVKHHGYAAQHFDDSRQGQGQPFSKDRHVTC
uniref:Uncharacterized protein n=1 Tax=Romanomermis culicivorax TaxID=13658 RepID=A0A915L5R2_ROMCU